MTSTGRADDEGPTTTRLKKTSNGYSYKYTELATIHEEMERQGITYRQFVKYLAEPDADYIFTILKYGDEEELPPMQGCRIIAGEGDKLSVMQRLGSSLTYARRYSLLMALGWACEDDDGASAGTAPAPKRAVARLDFSAIEAKLGELDTFDELVDYYKTLLAGGMSGKQQDAVRAMFAKRKQTLGIQV